MERLESRAMLAIFAYDRPDGSTLVAIDGNAGLTDLYMRGTGGGMQLSTNSEFLGVWTSDALDWTNPNGLNPNIYSTGSNPLYITSATPNQQVIPLTEANGFTAGSTSTNTDFVLSNGSVEVNSPGDLTGLLTYGANTWSFTNYVGNGDIGTLTFTLVSGSGSGPAPISRLSIINPGSTQADNRGAGGRGTISIAWTAPVSTYFASAPRIETASYRYAGSGGSGIGLYRPWTEFDIGVTVGSTSAFTFPATTPKNAFSGTTLLSNGAISRVPGTTVQSGTITVYDVSPTGVTGFETQNLTFNFTNATGQFVFTPQQNDWLQIAAGSTLGGLRFVNRYAGAGGAPFPGTINVLPGRVTIQGTETWFEYTAESTPSDVTVWAGLDVANSTTVELTRSGGSFNVLSPIVAAPALTVLGASSVNLEAPISVTGGIALGQGQVPGSARPNVNTAVFDAASAAASYGFTVVDGSLTVSPSGSLAGALPTPAGALQTAAGSVSGRMVDADLFVQGTIFATTQFYDLNNFVYTRPNYFTTRSDATGLDSGLVRGGTVVINMAAEGAGTAPPDPTNADSSYHVVDLRTQVDTFRTRAAGTGLVYPGQDMYPYEFSVREADAITFDAVAGSSRPISLAAEGAMTMKSALSTLSDVTIAALTPAGGSPNPFTVSAPILTKFGVIDISAGSVTVGNSVQVTNASVDPDATDIMITATSGDLISRNLISAVNGVSLVQRVNGSAAGRVDASGIRARTVTVEAAGDVTLGTTVETLVGRSGGGFSIRESDDIAVTSLRAGGRVALSATGYDGGTATANPIALTANVVDATALEVSTPNGSADVLVNTPRLLSLGGAASPVIPSMQASGNVRIRSTAGDVRVSDAPVAGGNARTVRVASTGILPATYSSGTVNVTSGTLTGTGSINALGMFDGQTLRIGDRVLVRLGSTTTTNSNGVYTVARVGGGVGINANWQLTRAADSDTAAELPSGSYVGVAAGATQGGTVQQIGYLAYPKTVANLSATDTIEIATSYPALGQLTVGTRVVGASLSGVATITSINVATGVITLTPGAVSPGGSSVVTFVAPALGRSAVSVTPRTLTTNIGSDAIAKTVAFVVSSTGGTNSSAGSLGKMLQLRQQNDTAGSVNPNQIMTFTVGGLSGPIRLTQELPVIRKAFAIAGGGAVVDGSRIVTARNGLATTAASTVNGFEFVAGSGATTDGSGNPRAAASLSGFTIAGFGTGAGVRIDNVAGVLVSGVTFGRDETGQRLANRQGVLVTGAAATSATILGSTILSSTDAGLAVENGASGVKLVGSTAGATNLDNAVGVRLASATGGSQIGVEPAGPSAALPQAAVALASGSATVTLPAGYGGLASLYAGLGVRGTGIPAGAVITAVNMATRVVTLSAAATVTGASTLTFGNFVTTAVGTTTLVLPQGVPMGSLFLGQAVSGAGIPAAARIAAIDPVTRRITLTAATTAASTTAVTFGVGGRNAITANLYGITLSAGANTVVNTDIYGNAYDGMVISGGTQQIGTVKKTSSTSNAIYANGGYGIVQTSAAVAAQQKIWGNYIGMTVNGRTSSANVGGSITPARAVDPTTQLDADGNQYGPASNSSGGGSGGGSGSPTVRPRV